MEGTVTADPQGTLFVALASLTADPDPAPVHTLATTRLTRHGIEVTWQDGTRTHLALLPPSTKDDGPSGAVSGT